jgi:subtilisin-like proprotein convertase family protein
LCFSLFPIQAQAVTYRPASTNPQPQTAPLSQVNQPPLDANQSAFVSALPTAINQAPGYRKVVVDNSDQASIATLAKNGSFLLADYGAFSLWKTPSTAALGPVLQKASVEVHSDFDEIGLRGGKIDTTLLSLNDARTTAPQLWLVQFIGPVKAEWVSRLEKSGVEFVIYMPNNAYVVWADGNQVAVIEKQVGLGNTELQWSGAYRPEYRLDPALKNAKPGAANQVTKVTVQFYTTSAIQTSLAQLQKLGGRVIQTPYQVMRLTNITLEVPTSEIQNIAAWPDVYNVEAWSDPVKLDEVQGQIVAGNVSTNITGQVLPAAPGYLSWLQSQGFPTTPSSYPIVDVVDDGVDNGTTTPLHPDFYTNGDKVNGTSRLVAAGNCTTDATPNAVGGHGNLNTGIVGAYNNASGAPYIDSNGFNRGVGISPFGRMSYSKIFRNSGGVFDISACGNNYAGIVLKSYQHGALISTNSWGAAIGGGYDSASQAYDSLTRDAISGVAGNQEMLHVFSAGNSGPGATTIGSPGTAKNIVTVGATENVRDQGVLDGCGESNADNADDMATFSSRGPTADGRIKPDIVAPGTHVQGPASQDPGFDGSGVCGGNGNKYYPFPPVLTQTLYTWSSGTSHSAPAVAGSMSLIYNYYGRVLNPGQTPSPALAKALIINSPRYLKGSSTGDTLPSPNQGWGDVNLGGVFDGVPRLMADESTLFTATGQQYLRIGTVHDPSKPVRVSLVWTDAPGATTGNSYVNNLDLQVTINGQIYKGNVFNGSLSVTGGAFDTKNNVENVFLPAGISGNFSVKVTAANLAGDGVPGNASSLDQDFALVIYNGDAVATPTPVLAQSNKVLSGGDGDGVIEPGETFNLQIALTNGGDADANNVTTQLTTSTPGVTINTGTAGYGNIAASATVTNGTLYNFTVGPNVPYGSLITFTQVITYNGGATTSIPFAYQLGVVNFVPTGNTLAGGDGDAYAEPGEALSLAIGIKNTGNADAYNVTGVLTTSTPGVTITVGTNNYGNIASGGSVTNTVTPYYFTLSPGLTCSGVITFYHTINYADGTAQTFMIPVQLGTPTLSSPGTYASLDVPKLITSTGTPIVTSTLPINFNGQVGKIKATLNISHTYDSDLVVTLISPDNTRVILINRRGSSNDNFLNTVLDDSAATAISAGTAPFTGTYRPEQPLANFNTKQINGTWKLEIQDLFNQDGGSLNSWSLDISPLVFVCDAPVAGSVLPTAGDGQGTPLNQPFPTALTAQVKDNTNTPVGGVAVTFVINTGPSGASGVFSGTGSTFTANTNGSGNVTAPTLVANGQPGIFQVVATTPGNYSPAVFNLSICGDNQTVTFHTDDGSGANCGTLSYALSKVTGNTPVTITFSLGPTRTIQVSGAGYSAWPVPANVTLDGGSDCTNPVVLDGTGTNAGIDGLTLNGATLKAITVTHFKGRQIVANGKLNKLSCVKAIK